MILMIDNYDSFTYNVVQYFGKLGADVRVVRNDKITVPEIEELHPQALVISPGPCTPREAGVSVEAIRHFAGKLPIFGICLGHQSIGFAFGAKIVRAKKLMHGKASNIVHDGRYLFNGMKNPFSAIRYHSLVIDRETLPSDFEITAESEDDREIMGIRHRKYPIYGVQFHPESVLTEDGIKIIENFLKLI
ncbi:anthranilate synthase component II [Thermovibrio ammonificans]|uniref:Glutamine amidotransferase of anthranilate synthase n=1 Tax=Thermovibrio ammonificans (strain DSM 15698 / JCM 12110 / HB-1) TaxID=648996 RepID=E8T402_THEA1|nr:aminodeoxychorismate/anthranilate synthase component II [Thermovibrio ammonificans]ADU96212.1 glutamine amidotransferase of anthranilate synthase [Thermovibrio ammonificans HB-1]